jgi:c-di-GMP-binding flagellar brake protein YcgR
MLRTPVKLHELLIGKPMPFDVYDREGRLLLRRGYVIESEQEKQKLFRLGPERDVSTDERFRAAFSSAARLEDKGSEEARRSVILPFTELHLLPGEPLQVKLTGDEEALWSRYIGIIRNRSLLIEAVTRSDLPIFVKEGMTLQLRGTTGSLAFLFTASVVANIARPFSYLHLSYPSEIRAVRLRRTERVKVRIVCAVLPEQGEPYGGVLLDLSLGGGLLLSRHVLGIGQRVTLKFKLPVGDNELILAVEAVVRSQRQIEQPNGQKENGYGVQFVDLAPEETLALMTYLQAVQSGAVG